MSSGYVGEEASDGDVAQVCARWPVPALACVVGNCGVRSQGHGAQSSLDRSAGIVLAWPDCWRCHSSHDPLTPPTRTSRTSRTSARTAGRRRVPTRSAAGSNRIQQLCLSQFDGRPVNGGEVEIGDFRNVQHGVLPVGVGEGPQHRHHGIARSLAAGRRI